MSPSPRILVVDDVPANLHLLIDALEPCGYELLTASSGESALKIAARAQPDLMLLDIMMPGLDGIETCRRLRADPAIAAIPVIFITALDDRERVVEGFRAGGADYLVKPFHAEEVVTRVQHQLRLSALTQALQQANAALRTRMSELEDSNRRLTEERDRRKRSEAALDTAGARLTAQHEREAEQWGVSGIVGDSDTLRRILADIARLPAGAATSVLITGESGTGKELVARAIHHASSRAQAPFVPVNCVAIPAELAESLLFGHTRGSFTGAVGDRKGCFELAHGGTLFLDEIGDMPPGLQAKLLRVLEDGVVVPVGASRELRLDVRVVAATNVDLPQKIASGAFRADLFYRLARFQVELPPLRERRGDILLLAGHFLRRFAAEMGLRPPALTTEATRLLREHAFPGNVRELKNLIERALILSGGEDIAPAHLHTLRAESAASAPDKTELPADLPYRLKDAEVVLINRAIRAAGGNLSRAAKMLDIHRARIYRMFAEVDSDSKNSDE
ncbi:MAG: sigma 54-interacting transcriptional regulator [Panacagrimonas sp.]